MYFVDTSILSVDLYLSNWAPMQLMPPCDACMRPNKSSHNSSFPSLDCMLTGYVQHMI